MSQSKEIDLQLPLDEEVIFTSAKGEYKEKIKKRQMHFLARLVFLKPFLSDDETIRFVTIGLSPISAVDYIFTGAAMYYLKRCMLVFTSKRIIHVPTKANLQYRSSIAQILYDDCKSITVKLGALAIEYKNGTSEKFTGIPLFERKKIKGILNNFQATPGPGVNGSRIHLCPRCGNMLEQEKYICQKCRLEFKNKEQAKKISILYPGGGYFYTRHPVIGISDAVTEIILLLFVISFAMDWASNQEPGMLFFIIFSLLLIVEKFVTVYHSNHFINEFIPVEKGVIYKTM